MQFDGHLWARVKAVGGLALWVTLYAATGLAQSPPQPDLISDRVGSLAGEFNVNESGNVSYRIPISIPPGTAGVQPQISLSYDSSGGNGSMGPGWSISGISAIARCKATRESGDFIVAGVAVDGDSLGVNLHPQDRFCLDGQRLLLISTDKSYGDPDSEYRLEVDRFTRIYSRGGNNTTYIQHTGGAVAYTGPQYFEVQRKDGSVSTYGNTADSRLEANNQRNPQIALVWGLDRFEDSSGNYILYEYEENVGAGTAGEQVLKRIRYTGKRQLTGQTAAASTPYAAITFDYYPNVLRAEGFVANSRTTRSRLLKSIDAAGARFFALTYAPSSSGTGESVLTSIKECSDSTEAVCYPPTAFTWSDAKVDLTDDYGPVGAGIKDLVSSRMGDVDGDGRLDMVWVDNAAQIPCGHNRLMIAFAERQEIAPDIGALRFNNGLGGIPVCTGFDSTGPGSIDQWWQLVDYNGDGRDDLLIAENPGPTANPTNPNARWKIHPSRGRFINGQSAGGFDTSVDLLANDGLNISVLATRSQMLLADFNGDGLSDMVYAIVTGSPGSELTDYYIRFLDRQTGTTQFKFSDAYVLNFDSAIPVGHPCTNGFCAPTELEISPSAKHNYRSQDLDGDGRADFYATLRETPPNRPAVPFADFETSAARTPDTLPVHKLVFRTRARNEALHQVDLEPIYSSYAISGLGALPTTVRELADFNGDGLQDVLIEVGNSNPARYRVCINYGPNEGGFQCETSDLTGMDALQLADIDGNGRADLVYLPPQTNRDTYRYRLAAPDGRTFGPEVTFANPSVNGQDDADRKTVDFFVDMDGDGLLDFFGIDPGDSGGDFRSSTSGTANRFQPRDAIVEIANGYGAKTIISYLPMTNSDVYRPDRCELDGDSASISETCTRNKDWDTDTPGVQIAGRGAPVMDALFPMFVVSHVESDAPTFTDSAARSLLSYRYVGAKLQGGGRGFLGFREIWTRDHNYTGSPAAHVLSRTIYGQRFPFIGMPVGTEKRVVAGAVSLSTCRTVDKDKEACRQAYAPGGFAVPASSLVASAQTAYATLPIFAPGAQAPLFAHMASTQERRFNLPAGASLGTTTGVLLSVTVTSEDSHDSYGNPLQITTDVHFSEPVAAHYDDSVLRRKRTINQYDTDNPTTWRLGRLSSTEVQSSRRTGPGLPLEMTSRKAQFSYDQSAANTGLLKKETIEPGASGVLELLTYYDLDDYGNRIATYTCSADVGEAACRAPELAGNPMLFQPVNGDAPATTVRRYARTTFDTIGRYPTSTREPFFHPSTSPPVLTNPNWIERAAQTVVSRDQWGEITGVQDVNGVDTQATRGALGRAYWSWTETGASTTTTYRWCTGVNGGDVSCPSGATFRVLTEANSGAQSWTYFDRLGRTLATATTSFNAAVSGQDVTISCVGYDAHGRQSVQTQPRFLTGILVAGAPSFVSQADVCTGAPYKSTTTFDVLARAQQTVGPDGATTTVTYTGLVTTTIAPCNNVGVNVDCNRPFSKEENAAGEVITATDANGFDVDYTRDPEGNVIAVSRWIAGQPIVNTAIYDTRGRKTSQTDTDSGTTGYLYNAAGELIESTDARGQRIRSDYDARGRAWRVRAESIPSSGDTLFRNGFESGAAPSASLIEDKREFDTSTNGYGLPSFETRAQQSATTVNRTLAYDSLSRVSTRITQLDGRNTTERSVYDDLGRPLKTVYEFDENYPNPTGAPVAYREGSENFYDARGYLRRVCKAPDASNVPSACPTGMPAQPVYWQIDSMDARGNITSDRRHGTAALATTRTFEPSTGRIATIQSGSSSILQSLSYGFDLAGNLTDRTDLGQSLVERFRYDKLDRLTESKLDGIQTPTLALTYDALGNICSKNGNAYIYDGRAGCAGALGQADKSAHAVTALTGGASPFTYAYDENGLQTLANGPGTAEDRTSEYDGFHRLTRTAVGSVAALSDSREFFYAPDLSLARQIEYSSAGQISRKTHYIGALEWTDRSGGGTINREARLGLPGGLILVTHFVQGSAPATAHRYAFTDHLGSIDVIANETGTAVERMSFDAHGRRRAVLDWQTLITYGVDETTRKGFTGHQQLDGAGLIHMNARAYDPRLGRFLQPDPMVEDDATQGWNRYTYVLNNPLTATDPTGTLSRREAIGTGRAIVAIAITIYTAGVINAGLLTPAAVNSAAVAAGFTSGLVAGGLQGAITGAFSASMFIQIGAHFQTASANAGGMSDALQAQKILAHGIAGGVLNRLQGGDFGHGFISAGMTELFAPGIAQIENAAVQTFVAAIVGGTVSELSGGKFANGAMTAAFAQAFGSITRRSKSEFSSEATMEVFVGDEETYPSGQNVYDQVMAQLRDAGVAPDAAGITYSDQLAYADSNGSIVSFNSIEAARAEGYEGPGVAGHQQFSADGKRSRIIIYRGATIASMARIAYSSMEPSTWRSAVFSREGKMRFAIGHEIRHSLDATLGNSLAADHWRANRYALRYCARNGGGCD